MLIKELSKRTKLPVATLRHYETYGFYEGHSDPTVETNNYKNYDESLVERIALIKGAREVGFSLAEIKGLLDTWFNEDFDIKQKVKVVNDKIREVNDKISQSKNVIRMLKKAIVDIENGEC